MSVFEAVAALLGALGTLGLLALGVYTSPLGKPLRNRAAARRLAREEDAQIRTLILGRPEQRARGQVVAKRVVGLLERMDDQDETLGTIKETLDAAPLLNGGGKRLIADVAHLKAWTVEHSSLHDSINGVQRGQGGP